MSSLGMRALESRVSSLNLLVLHKRCCMNSRDSEYGANLWVNARSSYIRRSVYRSIGKTTVGIV